MWWNDPMSLQNSVNPAYVKNIMKQILNKGLPVFLIFLRLNHNLFINFILSFLVTKRIHHDFLIINYFNKRSSNTKIIKCDFLVEFGKMFPWTHLWNFSTQRAKMAKLYASKHGESGKLWFCSFLADWWSWRHIITCDEAHSCCYALTKASDLDWL